jgi:carbon-monoxide dehydrogenase medium subunit
MLLDLGPGAAPYCGGTELLLVAKLGLTELTDLVDLKRIDELAVIQADGELRIGASVTHQQVVRSPIVRERWPSLAEMELNVANIRVRNVGTIVGNLCFANPHSDPLTYLIAAGGELTIRGSAAERRVTVEQFTRGPYETELGRGELVTSVHVPPPPAGSALVHRKMAFRERAAITVAANVSVHDGRVQAARVAIGSVGPVAHRLSSVEELLVGLDAPQPGEDRLSACRQAAAREVAPSADADGSVEYERHLAGVLVERCVREALRRAVSSS